MVQVIEKTAVALPLLGCPALERELRGSPYWSLRQLVCQVHHGRVIVRGTVPSYYLKQVAQSLAVKAFGVGCVESDIEVHDP